MLRVRLVIVLGLIIVASTSMSYVQAQGSVTPTATTIPPAVTLVFGQVINTTVTHTQSKRFEFALPQDRDVVITLDSSFLLDVSVCSSKTYKLPGGGGGGGGGCGHGEGAFEESPDHGIMLFPAGPGTEDIPANAENIKISFTLWVSRYFPGSANVRLGAYTVRPEEIAYGQSLASTFPADRPFQVFSFNTSSDNFDLVTAYVEDTNAQGAARFRSTTRCLTRLSGVRVINGINVLESPCSHFPFVSIDELKEHLRLEPAIGTNFRLLVEGHGRFKLWLLRHLPGTLTFGTQEITLSNREPLRFWKFDGVAGDTFAFDATIKAGAGAYVRVIQGRELFETLDLSETAKQSKLLLLPDNGPVYVFAYLPDSSDPGTVVLKLNVERR